MAVTSNEAKVSIILMVDIKARKVLFAEARKEFVDFLFNILSLPLSTVVKVLNEKGGMVGCLGSLYRSVETLDTEYFQPGLDKGSVLNSKTAVSVPLLSLNDVPKSINVYQCWNHDNATFDSRVACCSSAMKRLSYSYINDASKNVTPRFVKEAVAYMVMDDLEVKPLSITLIKAHVHDFDYLEEMEVQVGVKEAIAMLKASLETTAVLTATFLGKN